MLSRRRFLVFAGAALSVAATKPRRPLYPSPSLYPSRSLYPRS